MPAKAKPKAKPKTKSQNKALSKIKPASKLATKNHTVHDYADALREAKGYVSGAAQILDVTPSAVYKAIKRHPSLSELQQLFVEDRRQPALDVGEAKLMEAVWAGKSWAIKYYLNNQGAERGYGPKLALEGKLSAELTPGDPLAAYRAMPPERRKQRIAELLERAKALEDK